MVWSYGHRTVFIMTRIKKEKIVFKSPKGMRDILPADSFYWEKVYGEIKKVADIYSYFKIGTPIIESSEIFERTLGTVSDVIEKQMFFVKSRGQESLVLRPEGTAPVMRAYIENGLDRMPQPSKLYYEGPMFRYEQPQAGRLRQFHQVGFEVIGGESDPVYDAQVILVINKLLGNLKIKNLITEVNSMGCKTCRQNYKKKLLVFYKDKKGELCEDCDKRLNVNPLRLLDCKVCIALKEKAPIILDYLCKGCQNHFQQVLEFVEELKIPYKLNNYLVRGLDYYNKTVFEVFNEGDSGKLAIASGGRYDALSEFLGVKSISAVGGAIGIERVIEMIRDDEEKELNRVSRKKQIFFVYIGDTSKKKSLPLIDILLNSGFRVLEALGKESLKSQFRLADKEKIEWALIFGQREAFEESIILRDMKTGVQETIALKDLVEKLRKRIK